MTDVILSPESNEERQTALLAFAGVFGGGVIAYQAVRALRDKDLFPKVDGNPGPGFVGLALGIPLLGVAMKETADEYGWGPIIWGSLGISAVALAGRALRR